MKSKREDLANRGFVKQGFENDFKTLSLESKLQLLKSSNATERTLGARLLSGEKMPIAENLIEALKIEKKLYSKIEICKALVAHSRSSIKLLINELGEIGSNQHKHLPEKEFGKDNYPLPRDIAARTLANIGPSALPELMRVTGNNTPGQISEAIDAIGFICFYNPQPKMLDKLKACYINHSNCDLISWKIIRAMSGFPESMQFLLDQKKSLTNKRIIKEIDRSIRLIENRKNTIHQ